MNSIEIAIENNPTLRDCIFLSSGTIACLTGLKAYSAIDAVHERFVNFVLHRPPFPTWQSAWAAFRIKEGM